MKPLRSCGRLFNWNSWKRNKRWSAREMCTSIVTLHAIPPQSLSTLSLSLDVVFCRCSTGNATASDSPAPGPRAGMASPAGDTSAHDPPAQPFSAAPVAIPHGGVAGPRAALGLGHSQHAGYKTGADSLRQRNRWVSRFTDRWLMTDGGIMGKSPPPSVASEICSNLHISWYIIKFKQLLFQKGWFKTHETAWLKELTQLWKSRRIYPKYMPKCSLGFTRAHFSRNSGATNTVLFTIQTFNEHSRMAKVSQPYLRGHMRWNATSQ